MKHAFVVSLAAAVIAAGPLAAQVSLVPGARVRITAPRVRADHDVVAVVAVRADTLFVDLSAGEPLTRIRPLAVPIADITVLETPVRERNAGKGVAVGFLAGGLVGAGLGLAIGQDAPPCRPAANARLDFSCLRFAPSRGDAAAALGTIGALLGAAVGALSGSTTEHWVTAPTTALKPSISVGGRGVRLGASISF